MRTLTVLLFALLLQLPLWAQQTPPPLTAAQKTELINRVAQLLRDNYIFPDKAAAMGAYLSKRNKAKAYANISEYRAFVDTLASDLRKTHRDLHLHLHVNPEAVANIRRWQSEAPPTADMLAEQMAGAKRENFGFVKVERLTGNIGYLDFRRFFPLSEEAKNTVAASMSFLANSDAIIIDMRHNGGGNPEMVQLVLSYFMDETPVHYNTLYDRPSNQTQDYYSLAEVQGRKMPDIDIYVLTSKYTFSAAEEFSYNLQNLKRATIVGETTGGGAHPTQSFVVNDFVALNIPISRAISPFTQTNWEGTGVTPDIATTAEDALAQAKMMALTNIIAKTREPKQKALLEWEQQGLQARLSPPPPLADQLKQAYSGTYGDRIISLEGGELYYQRGERPKRKMIPLNESLFALEDLDGFRLKVEVDPSGRAEKLVGFYDNGHTDESTRTN
jgi:retinol-binding protein 3